MNCQLLSNYHSMVESSNRRIVVWLNRKIIFRSRLVEMLNRRIVVWLNSLIVEWYRPMAESSNRGMVVKLSNRGMWYG